MALIQFILVKKKKKNNKQLHIFGKFFHCYPSIQSDVNVYLASDQQWGGGSMVVLEYEDYGYDRYDAKRVPCCMYIV